MSWIKICGLRQPEEVDLCVELGVDAIGLVLVPSPRQVSPERARQLARRVPPEIAVYGVFRTIDAGRAREAGLSFVQGVGDPDGLQHLPVIHDGPQLAARTLPPRVLVDSAVSGSGQTGDWHRIAPLARRVDVVLAGGLAPDNIADAIRQVQPFGVDVSSGVESHRGIKDLQRIRDFVHHARRAFEETSP